MAGADSYPPNSVLACDFVDLAAQTGLDREALADLSAEEVVALNMEVETGEGAGDGPPPVDRHLPGLRNDGKRMATNCGCGGANADADDVASYVSNAGVVTREPDATASESDADRRPAKSSAPMARPTARVEAMLAADAPTEDDDWTDYVSNVGVVQRPPDSDDDRE